MEWAVFMKTCFVRISSGFGMSSSWRIEWKKRKKTFPQKEGEEERGGGAWAGCVTGGGES